MDSTLILAILGALLLVIIAAYSFSGNSEALSDKKQVQNASNETSSDPKTPNRAPAPKGVSQKGINDPPTKVEMNAISKNISGALKRLKTEYPPDSRLIINFRGVVFSGDIKKVYEVAKGGYIAIATQLAKRLLDDRSSSSTDFMNLVATLGAICIMDDHDFKVQAGNKALLQTLAEAYEKYKSGTYFNKADRDRFVGTMVMLLAGITVADEPMRPILKTPHLFELGVEGIYQPNACLTAVLFYMNASYEDHGRELLRKCEPQFFEAIVDFLALVPTSYPDAYQQIYLTFSNLYLHSDDAYKKVLTKILLDRGFFESLARDIRRLQLDAIGLTMNIFQHNQIYDGVLSYDLLSALADAASLKQCGKQNMENISGILYNLVITKKAPQALMECSAQEPLQRLAESESKSVAEYAEVLLTKIGTLTGEVSVIERKCSNVNCEVRSDKLKKCSQCSSAWYCSKECQQLKERSDQVPKKQGNMDRTVALTFLHEHVQDFDLQARQQHLNLDQCVIVVDFSKPARQKIAVHSIDKFFAVVVKKEPYTLSGCDIDLPRLKNSHAGCGRPAFIGVVIQPTSISAFVVPLVLQSQLTQQTEQNEQAEQSDQAETEQ